MLDKSRDAAPPKWKTLSLRVAYRIRTTKSINKTALCGSNIAYKKTQGGGETKFVIMQNLPNINNIWC